MAQIFSDDKAARDHATPLADMSNGREYAVSACPIEDVIKSSPIEPPTTAEEAAMDVTDNELTAEDHLAELTEPTPPATDEAAAPPSSAAFLSHLVDELTSLHDDAPASLQPRLLGSCRRLRMSAGGAGR